MHCDDKRMLFVLKEEITKNWKSLEESKFQSQELLEKLNQSFLDYFECKKESE